MELEQLLSNHKIETRPHYHLATISGMGGTILAFLDKKIKTTHG